MYPHSGICNLGSNAAICHPLSYATTLQGDFRNGKFVFPVELKYNLRSRFSVDSAIHWNFVALGEDTS
jgi:hypothetical protein